MASGLGFGKSQRLLDTAGFRAVFDQNDWKVATKEILCLSRCNGSDHPRLGLVIAKKNVRHAVQRNRIKRIIRESFRRHQHQLPPLDIVILARRGMDEFNNSELHAELTVVWQRLITKAVSKPASHETAS